MPQNNQNVPSRSRKDDVDGVQSTLPHSNFTGPADSNAYSNLYFSSVLQVAPILVCCSQFQFNMQEYHHEACVELSKTFKYQVGVNELTHFQL
jgi:hypothetical protein